MLTFATLGLVLLSAPAQATNCDTYVRQAANHTGDRLVSTFSRLAECDSDIAAAHYQETFLQHNGNTLPTLVGLTMAAIEHDVWVPAWGQLNIIVRAASYETRDEIARQVGEACLDTPKVVTFLQGAYIGIRSTIGRIRTLLVC